MDVSIIIVNWNTRNILSDCLRSVYDQTKDVSFEVIVIDNGSIDGSADMVEDDFPAAHLIQNRENLGFAAANNQGLRIAKGRYSLLLNSDTVVIENAVSKAVKFADSQPQCAVTGCKVLNTDLTMQPSCFTFPSILNMILSATFLYKLFPKSKFFGREQMTWFKVDRVQEVDVVMGCFMLIRKQAAKQVGFMDERFFMYAEETDWCYRFKMSGWKVLFTPQPKIIHLGGASSEKIASDMTLQLRGAILQFIQKHHSRLSYSFACLLTALFFALRIPIWFLRIFLLPEKRILCWSKVSIYSKGLWRILTGRKAICWQFQRD